MGDISSDQAKALKHLSRHKAYRDEAFTRGQFGDFVLNTLESRGLVVLHPENNYNFSHYKISNTGLDALAQYEKKMQEEWMGARLKSGDLVAHKSNIEVCWVVIYVPEDYHAIKCRNVNDNGLVNTALFDVGEVEPWIPKGNRPL